MIKISNLSYRVNDKNILNNISLQIPLNKITAIIGPNGCGKTTLLSHLSRKLSSKQKIFIQNIPIENISLHDYAKKIAVMSQQQNSFTLANFKVKDIVLMGRYPHKQRFSKYGKNDFDIMQHCLQLVGIEQLSDKKIAHLSGGELQRVFIAKTLAQQTEIIILDEPTNHLDIKYKLQLMEILKNFQGTVIMVLHDLSLASRFCDNIILLSKGHIFASGKTNEVMTLDNLKAVFGVSFFEDIQENQRYLYY